MTLSLLLLGVACVLTFLGKTKRIGTPWVVTVVILLLTLGVVIAPIELMGMSISISGLLIPLVVAVALVVRLRGVALAQVIVASVVVGGAAVIARYYIPEVDFVLLSNVVIGLLCGTVACLLTRDIRASIASAMLGIVMFEIGQGIADRWVFDTVYLGNLASFDAIVIASFVCATVKEATRLIRKEAVERIVDVTDSDSIEEQREKYIDYFVDSNKAVKDD